MQIVSIPVRKAGFPGPTSTSSPHINSAQHDPSAVSSPSYLHPTRPCPTLTDTHIDSRSCAALPVHDRGLMCWTPPRLNRALGYSLVLRSMVAPRPRAASPYCGIFKPPLIDMLSPSQALPTACTTCEWGCRMVAGMIAGKTTSRVCVRRFVRYFCGARGNAGSGGECPLKGFYLHDAVVGGLNQIRLFSALPVPLYSFLRITLPVTVL